MIHQRLTESTSITTRGTLAYQTTPPGRTYLNVAIQNNTGRAAINLNVTIKIN